MKSLQILPAIAVALLAIDSGLAAEIRVLDQAGKPIPGARLLLRSGENLRGEALTGPNGAATIDLHGPSASISASAPGFVPMRFEGRANAPVELRLPEAEDIGGRVLDPSGKPVPGARIVLTVPQSLSGPWIATDLIVTGADGSWSCDWSPKNAEYVKVDALHLDYAFSSEDADRQKLRTKSAVHTLAPVVTLRGQIRDPDGNPVRGATVALGSGTQLWPSRDLLERITGQDGRFEFAKIRGEDRVLGVRSSNHAPLLLPVKAVPGMKSLELTLQPGARLRVRVFDEQGAAVPDAVCRIDDWPANPDGQKPFWSYPEWEWRTDATGAFEWPNAPAEPANWTISRGGYMTLARVQLKPGDTEHRLVLLRPFRTHGKVIDAATRLALPEFFVTPRFVFPGASANSPTPWSGQPKRFEHGSFDLSFERPLLMGGSRMHDWQFRAEAIGYLPAISRVLQHAETGAAVDFALTKAPLPEVALELKPAQRVAFAAWSQTNVLRMGESIALTLSLKIAPGHHIYALGHTGGTRQPLTIGLKPPPGCSLAGEWQGPAPETLDDGSKVYKGQVQFQNLLRAEPYGNQRQPRKFTVSVSFQACNDLVCWPPEELSHELDLTLKDPRMP